MSRLAIIALGLLAVSALNAADAPNRQPADQFITPGTEGGPVSDRNRSQSANALVIGQAVYLVDAGDGAAQQLAEVMVDHVIVHFLRALGLRAWDQVGQMAAKAKVRRVVMTHLVAGRDPNVDTAPLVAGVRNWFGGPVEIAADLNRY